MRPSSRMGVSGLPHGAAGSAAGQMNGTGFLGPGGPSERSLCGKPVFGNGTDGSTAVQAGTPARPGRAGAFACLDCAPLRALRGKETERSGIYEKKQHPFNGAAGHRRRGAAGVRRVQRVRLPDVRAARPVGRVVYRRRFRRPMTNCPARRPRRASRRPTPRTAKRAKRRPARRASIFGLPG